MATMGLGSARFGHEACELTPAFVDASRSLVDLLDIPLLGQLGAMGSLQAGGFATC